MPAPICWVGELAKQLVSHAKAAASHFSLSTRNLIDGPLIVMFFTSPAMVVISVRQLKISLLISGAKINPWLPKLNADSALRSLNGIASMLVECINERR